MSRINGTVHKRKTTLQTRRKIPIFELHKKNYFGNMHQITNTWILQRRKGF